MCKRKEPETCSESSEVYNPDDSPECVPCSPYGFLQNPVLNKKRCMAVDVNSCCFTEDMITAQHPNLCASFHHFLAQETNDDHQTREANVSDVSPSLSSSCSDHSSIMGCQSNISDFDNCHKENHSDSFTNVNSSVQTPTVSSTDSRPRSKFSMLFGAPLVTVPIDAVPVDAVPPRKYHPDMGFRAYPPQEVKWTMKKVLTTSDCNDLHRLTICKKLVEEQFIPYLSESDRVELSSRNGLHVDVLDCDMGTRLKLTLKKWPSNNCYGLINNWKRDFVDRRGLKPGDQVGIFWDKRRNRLFFSRLKRSSLVGC